MSATGEQQQAIEASQKIFRMAILVFERLTLRPADLPLHRILVKPAKERVKPRSKVQHVQPERV